MPHSLGRRIQILIGNRALQRRCRSHGIGLAAAAALASNPAIESSAFWKACAAAYTCFALTSSLSLILRFQRLHVGLRSFGSGGQRSQHARAAASSAVGSFFFAS